MKKYILLSVGVLMVLGSFAQNKNFTYKLSLSLYQGRTAGQEAKVSLVVNTYRPLL